MSSPFSRPPVGMHGEHVDWIDSHTPLYQLGHGARCYDPTLQAFLSRDPYSPFSVGGISPYAFCAGDPVNCSDHSGYVSSGGWAGGIVLGLFGLALALATGGISLIVGLSVGVRVLAAMSALSGLAAEGLGFAAMAVEERDPEQARLLGWLSLGFGIVSAVTGILMPARLASLQASGRLVVGHLSGRRGLKLVEESFDVISAESREAVDFAYATKFREGSLVMTHGAPGELQIPSGEYLDPATWAHVMQKGLDLPADRPLYLMSCGAARNAPGTNLSNAAIVAKTLGRTVLTFDSGATRSIIRTTFGKRRLYAGYDINLQGTLRAFAP